MRTASALASGAGSCRASPSSAVTPGSVAACSTWSGTRVDHVYDVTRGGERLGVHARGAAHVEDPGRRLGQHPGEHVPRAEELEASGAGGEAYLLAATPVVVEDLGAQHAVNLVRL